MSEPMVFDQEEVKEITTAETLKSDQNYFNSIGKLSCGIMVFAASHSGKYMEESCFSNDARHQNAIILLGDGRILIMIWPMMAPINGQQAVNGATKWESVGPLFVDQLNKMAVAIPVMSSKTARFILMHSKLYVELSFMVEYITKLARFCDLTDEAKHVTVYLHRNLWWWMALAEDTKKFFDNDLLKFINPLKDAWSDLNEVIINKGRLPKGLQEKQERVEVEAEEEPRSTPQGAIVIDQVDIKRFKKLLISVVEASRILGISPGCMKRRGIDQKLPIYYYPISKKFFFKIDELEAYKKREMGR